MDNVGEKLENPVVCQSCGSTIYYEEDFGTLKDGTQSSDYCRLCMEYGEFNDEGTSYDEHIASIAQILVDMEKLSPDEARRQAEESVSDLKRWQELKKFSSLSKSN